MLRNYEFFSVTPQNFTLATDTHAIHTVLLIILETLENQQIELAASIHLAIANVLGIGLL